MGKKTRFGVLVFLLPLACTSRVKVLEDRSGLGSKGNEPGGPLWSACEPSQLDDVAAVGDRCSWVDSPCGRTDWCQNRFFDCNDGSLNISSTNLLDCGDPGTAMTANPVGLTECRAALESGHTADTCTGDWSCAQATDDPCCIEVGWCRAGGLVWPSEEAVLYRARLCQEKCESIPTRTAASTVTGCLPEGAEAPPSGTPCEGAFVCDRMGNDLSTGSIAATDIGFDRLYWCRSGVVQSLFLTLPWLN